MNFSPKLPRRDIPICADCQVSDSCLLDGLAKSNTLPIGRRAGLTTTAIRSISGQILKLFNNGSSRLSDYSEAYQGKSKAEFFASDERALPLVHEVMRWQADVAEVPAVAGHTGEPEAWPTDLAIQLRDQITQP